MRTKDEAGIEERGTVGGRARRDQIERAVAEVLADVGYAAVIRGELEVVVLFGEVNNSFPDQKSGSWAYAPPSKDGPTV